MRQCGSSTCPRVLSILAGSTQSSGQVAMTGMNRCQDDHARRAKPAASIAKESNFTREHPGRRNPTAPVKAQQPKTKPDDALKFLGCYEHCGDNKRIDEARRAGVIVEAQRKRLQCRSHGNLRISRKRAGHSRIGKKLTGKFCGCKAIDCVAKIYYLW